jgi:MoaA/NifB/PqqE/SkfB family radical SAM enzyme
MKTNKNFNLEKQEILSGSRILKNNKTKNRIDFFNENASENYLVKNNILDKENFLKKFQEYRNAWNGQPDRIINKFGEVKKKEGYKLNNSFKPLCLDLELASICDLACPHCFREYLATPDKIMKIDLAKEIILDAVKNNIPSIKFNWRGEPLLHSNLANLVKFAKDNGVLETIINTNATNLTEKKGVELINSGLDYMIYSFDGGTKKTYEKLRPGRFHENKFEKVIQNITNFSKLKKKLNVKFPYTKIQMVLMENNRDEIESFFEIFDSIVDEVTITPYQERGGNLEDLDKTNLEILKKYLLQNNLPKDTPYMIDGEGNLSISMGRKTCTQIFQRLMVTYDGKTGMCCNDWGAQYNLGYLNNMGFDSKKEEEKVIKNVQINKKGFELLKDIKMPKEYNKPAKKVSNINEIWNSDELNKVRYKHLLNNLDEINICKGCNSKDTFRWKKIN